MKDYFNEGEFESNLIETNVYPSYNKTLNLSIKQIKFL